VTARAAETPDPIRPRRLSGLGASGGRFLLGLGYGLAAALTVLCVFLASRAPLAGPIGPASQAILGLLLINLLLILGLATVVGSRVVRLFGARTADAGARLHLRFVALFGMAAVLPAIVVALFFGVLVTRGVESWFSQRVRTVVENSATVAKSYVNEQTRTTYSELLAMTTDLNRAAPLFKENPVSFGRILEGQAANRYFPAAYVIDREGRVLASAESASAPAFVAPPPATMRDADTDVVIRPFESADLLRAIYRLKAYDDAYLYVVRRVDPGILNHLRATEGSLQAYRDAEQNRHKIQAVFALTYVDTVLLVLVGAVWLGLAAAGAIAAPVARLVQAADRVAGGDLSARVEAHADPDEIAVLSRAFNRMTSDLQAQQAALRAAGLDAESRRQFIETVLAGVSAGVVGIDKSGRISAANDRAGILLGVEGELVGQKLGDAAPELREVVAKAGRGSAEEELDIVRGSEARRLNVRASRAAEGGLVLTFDDITRLVTAQRNAAWKDVARRIAHEIKNPLTPIQLSAERLRRKYRGELTGDLEIFDRCIETITRQVGDIGRMVDEFSAFARMPAPRFAVVDAAEMLRQGVFAQRVADPDTTLDLVEGQGDFKITADAAMVGQALTNVLKNAGEAIQARRHADHDLQGRIVARLIHEGDAVVIEVEDNGVGLPDSHRERLTEPYVTTREKGTGLGLAIVKRILEDHGGELILLDADALPGAKAVLRFPKTLTDQSAALHGAEVA
jgi:two-component system, NtrC family, nitrogen regulation sensor histidine kinase NtrY